MSTDSSTAAGRFDSPASLPDGSALVLRVMPLPADVNGNGDVFGGWIMAQVDMAGAVLPSRIARGRIATVAVNQFIFKQPVSIGDLLSFYARVERIGRISTSSTSRPALATCQAASEPARPPPTTVIRAAISARL